MNEQMLEQALTAAVPKVVFSVDFSEQRMFALGK